MFNVQGIFRFFLNKDPWTVLEGHPGVPWFFQNFSDFHIFYTWEMVSGGVIKNSLDIEHPFLKHLFC